MNAMPKENDTEKTPFIIITNEWIDKWLPYLNENELKVYMRLAYHYNHKKGISFPGQQTISESIEVKSKKPVINAIAKLEDLGLIERLKKPSIKGKKGWPSNQYRMLHVDDNGYHRAKRQRSSLKEAEAELRGLKKFLLRMYSEYNSDEEALPEAFKLNPDFKEAYYSQGWDKKEDFSLFEGFGIFSISSFWHKYEDIKGILNKRIGAISRDTWDELKEQENAVKKDMNAQWERVKEDYEYCISYLDNHHPEYIQDFNEAMELKAKRVKEWNKKPKEITEKHPDIKDVMQYFNYGIFKELSEKHGIATREIARLVKEITQKDDGIIGLACDFDGYVNKIYLPDAETLVTEEENRFLDLTPEDRVYKDEETGEVFVMSKGFTKDEKRDFKGTLKKIEKAKCKVIDTLVEEVASVLAEVYVDGQIREAERGYKPDKWYWKDEGNGRYGHELERGYHPSKMGLNDLLKHATYEINHKTDYIRGERDPYEDDPLVTIPPVTIEEIRAKFEAEKERLLAEKKEAEQATG